MFLLYASIMLFVSKGHFHLYGIHKACGVFPFVQCPSEGIQNVYSSGDVAHALPLPLLSDELFSAKDAA